MTGKEAEKSIIEMFAAAAGIRSTVREVRDGVAEAKQAIQTVRADAAAKERERRDAERCVWTEARLSIVPGDEPDAYASSCGEMWCWFDLVEHEVKFCFGCGKRIKIAPEAREETE